MDYSTLKIMSPAVTNALGLEGASKPLSSEILDVVLRYVAISYYKNDIEKLKPIKAKSYGGIADNEVLDIIGSFEQTDNTIGLANIKTLPTELKDGWVALVVPASPISNFLSQIIPSIVFVNESLKKTFIFHTGTSGSSYIETVCACAFRLLPYYFSADGKLTEDDKNFFRSILLQNTEDVHSYSDKLCENIDFDNIYMSKSLFGWTNTHRSQLINKLSQEVKKYRDRVNDYYQKMIVEQNYLDSAQTNLAAMTSSPEADNESLINFFVKRPHLKFWKVSKGLSDNYLHYSVVTTIEFFDDAAYETAEKNKKSWIYEILDDKLRKLYHALFIERKGEIRTESVFKMLNLSGLSPEYGTSNRFKDSVLPHPHLAHHTCLGGNKTYIAKYMEQGNWDMAIEQSIAATKNINFGDIAVMRSMASDIKEKMNTKFIIADNGQDMSPNEFLAYIGENE